MTYQALIAAALAIGSSGAMAGELPTYQVDGFVITPHQQALLIPANAQERLPEMALAYGSPHQIMVLTPRRNPTIEAAVPSAGMRSQSSENLLIKVSH